MALKAFFIPSSEMKHSFLSLLHNRPSLNSIILCYIPVRINSVIQLATTGPRADMEGFS